MKPCKHCGVNPAVSGSEFCKIHWVKQYAGMSVLFGKFGDGPNGWFTFPGVEKKR